jgi:RHS repeat-associated protein
LANLHGDTVVTASTDPAATALLSTFEATEFGTPRTGTSPRYGRLGAKQRETDDLTGIMLMGVRLYVPAMGRFLQVAPVPGGSANDYDYCSQDPINCFDLDGLFPWGKWLDRASFGLGVAGMFGCGPCAAASAAISLGRGIYRIKHGDRSGWWDVAGPGLCIGARGCTTVVDSSEPGGWRDIPRESHTEATTTGRCGKGSYAATVDTSDRSFAGRSTPTTRTAAILLRITPTESTEAFEGTAGGAGPTDEMNQNPGRIADRADLKLLSSIDRLLASQRRLGFQFSTEYRQLLMGEQLETNATGTDRSLKTLRDMLVGVWIVVGVLVAVAGLAFLGVVHLDGLLGVVASTFWGFMVGGPFAMSMLRGVPERLWRRLDKVENLLLFMLWLVFGVVFSWVLS